MYRFVEFAVIRMGLRTDVDILGRRLSLDPVLRLRERFQKGD